METSQLHQDISKLLHWLCVEWGFCISHSDSERIAKLQCIEADEFAREVLISEGMNPEFELDWFRRIKNRFIQNFGTNSVDVSNYN